MGCIKKSQTYDFTQQFLISMIIAKLSRCLASSINDIQLLRMKVKNEGLLLITETLVTYVLCERL